MTTKQHIKWAINNIKNDKQCLQYLKKNIPSRVLNKALKEEIQTGLQIASSLPYSKKRPTILFV